MAFHVSTLSKICLYLLTPALTFNSLANSAVDLGTIRIFALSAFVVPLLLAVVISLFYAKLGWDKARVRSMLLPTIFSNTGNFGLPICLFAFGTTGMELGVVYMVIQSFTIATLGVFIAASSNLKPLQAGKKVLRMPTLYGALGGMAVKLLNLTLPQVLARPIDLLAQAAIPVFLLVLGLQLSQTATVSGWKVPTVASLTRLLLAPALVAGLGKLVGLHGLPFKILVLQSAMPPPVNATILAREFDANPNLVSQATFLSTLMSLVTLSGWIHLLS